MILLSGKQIKESYQLELKSMLEQTTLSFFLYSDPLNEDCQSYLKSIKRMLDSFQITYVETFYDRTLSEEENLRRFQENIQDHAVLLARPLPCQNEEAFIESIPSAQDPDMLTQINRGRLYGGDLDYLPATAKSAQRIVRHYQIPLQGKKVTVVGRSISVGLPLFAFFLKENATVTLCHSKTSKEDLRQALINADIIALASGVKNLVDPSWLDSKKVVIDCGYSDGTGDLNFIPENVFAYTPVPGGVGALTSYCLLENALKIQKK